MNQKNFEYLKHQLKYSGMGETFDGELKQNMNKGDNDFKILRSGIINNSAVNKDIVNVELNFKKSEQTDMYFFNSYKVNVQKEENKPGMQQTFYINKDNSSITMKEAYNLMEGRAVHKELKTREGEGYDAWLKLDFKQTDNAGNFKMNQFHKNYGYDLEASLSKHAIKELLTPEYKNDLMNSLKKGNLQSVTFLEGKVESKMFVEANPQFKTITIYDENHKRINQRETNDQQKSESEKTSKKQSNKDKTETTADDSSEKNSPTKKKRRKQSNSM
ncbi:hypothetical protein I5M07_00140 [Flavobacterium sp. SE-1-e]|uniref:DUF3945 domain-containing protein n=2 Tax=Flavobacterium agrisoli TaxID=2793066 RepID=A0A934PJV5_9FLAO|nr:hypothetical protein [Flavobacterium agrisoli]